MSKIENKFKYQISRYSPFLWFFALVYVIVWPLGLSNGQEYSATFYFLGKRSPEFVHEWIRKEMKKRNTEYRRQVAFLRVKKD